MVQMSKNKEGKPSKSYLHTIFWTIAELALIIPVILLLWWFGQLIENKQREDSEPAIQEESESAAVGRYQVEGVLL